MAKFKKGDRVRCVIRDAAEGIIFEVGSLAIVKETYPATPYMLELTGGFLVYAPRWEVSNKSTASEHEPEITVNGAVYILKPEPEHVWQFGDWARHPWCGICFVKSVVDGGDYIKAVRNDGTDVYLRKKEITYISTAEIPS